MVAAVAINRISSTQKIILSIICMIICSKASVYLYPVPITLQTFAVYMMALFLSPKESFLTMLGYLTLGAAGFSVFAGAFGFTTVGYLVGMLLGAPLGSYLVKKRFDSVLSCIACYLTIHLFGCIWLSNYVGWSLAFSLGVVPFIMPGILKIAIACGIKAKNL